MTPNKELIHQSALDNHHALEQLLSITMTPDDAIISIDLSRMITS